VADPAQTIVPMLVRLVVATDWDAGFELTQGPPLPDVPPYGEYVTECAPQRAVAIRHVIVRGGFKLSRFLVGTREITVKLSSASAEDWRYQVVPPVEVMVGDSVVLHLRNETAVARKPKNAALFVDREDLTKKEN
jgi:hypothetical protein